MFCQIVFTELKQLINEDHFVIVKLSESVTFKYDNLFQAGHVVAGFEVFVQLLIVFDKQKRCTAIVHQVGKLTGRICRIDSGRDTTDQHNAHVTVEPVAVIFRQDSNRLTTVQTETDQTGPHPTGVLVIVCPAIGFPDAQVFLAMCNTLGILQASVFKQSGNCVVAIDLDGLLWWYCVFSCRHCYRHVFFRFQRF